MVPEQAVLLLADLDGAAAELRNQDLVTGLDADGNAVAGLVECARANGEDLGLVQLLDGGLGQEDAACGLGLGLEALDEHAGPLGEQAAGSLVSATGGIRSEDSSRSGQRSSREKPTVTSGGPIAATAATKPSQW